MKFHDTKEFTGKKEGISLVFEADCFHVLI